MHKFSGDLGAVDLFTSPNRDSRFKDHAWNDNFFFNFVKQSYLMNTKVINDLINEIDYGDSITTRKVRFYVRLFTEAMAPSNFAATNPQVLRETIESNGANLAKGMEQLLHDLQNSKNILEIKTTDMNAFQVGENLAITPGKVVFQNELMQLIHYQPKHKTCYKSPLLIIPPWINKYYILDLKQQNSFVNWVLDQGYNVFIISWINPDKNLADKNFVDYMLKGPLAALDAIQHSIGASEINAIGYCLGGTLLTCLLAYLAAKKDKRIKAATFFTTLIDFSDSGDLGVFLDQKQIEGIEQYLNEQGYFDGVDMSNTFNMLRTSDMIWNFFINNYLLGKTPFPFDLLYWNADSTRLTAAMHSFYLRNMYLDNKLIQAGGITLDGVKIDIKKITIPLYFLATSDDHIVPWRSSYKALSMFKGQVKFTLSASGHIAGVINHPDANKYCYWTNDALPLSPDEWMHHTKKHEGSWWPAWHQWLQEFAGAKVPAIAPERGKLKIIEDAPGSYVKVRC
jgi:polyhydroxyalkanoate synthase